MSRIVSTVILAISVLYSVTFDAYSKDMYQCIVESKFSNNNKYSEKQIKESRFSVLIIDNDEDTIIKRCSFVKLDNAVTCDEYEADYKNIDSVVGHRKYYYFRGQFDVQIFSNMNFVENNGRGSVAFGKCEKM